MLYMRGQHLISKWVLNCSKWITNSRRRIGCGITGWSLWQHGSSWVALFGFHTNKSADTVEQRWEVLKYKYFVSVLKRFFSGICTLLEPLFHCRLFTIFCHNFLISAKSSSKVVFHLRQNNIFTLYFYLSKGVESMFFLFVFLHKYSDFSRMYRMWIHFPPLLWRDSASWLGESRGRLPRGQPVPILPFLFFF